MKRLKARSLLRTLQLRLSFCFASVVSIWGEPWSWLRNSFVDSTSVVVSEKHDMTLAHGTYAYSLFRLEIETICTQGRVTGDVSEDCLKGF